MRSKRNLMRFLALLLALLFFMAVGAMAMFASPSLAAADEMVGPVAFFVCLVALVSICAAGVVRLALSMFTAPRSRHGPDEGLAGASCDDQMMNENSGLGAFKDVRRKAWRPPRDIDPGGGCYASISCSSTQVKPPGEPRLAKAGISTYAFNARDRGYSGLPALTSVLESCTEKARGVAAAFKKACSDLFTFDARARGTVMQV